MKKLKILMLAGVMAVTVGMGAMIQNPHEVTEPVEEETSYLTRIHYEDTITREVVVIPVPIQETWETEASVTEEFYSAYEFKRDGCIYWGDYRWTWYSEKVLPGGGLKIPGRHTDKDGYICDENDYICLASNTLSKGAIVPTPFGKMGKVYDCGCDVGTMDTYVSW